MTELLTWLEGSALGQAVRGAGVWSYAIINLVHIVGVASLFGSVVMLDLKLLGCFARTELQAISRPTVTLAATGFMIAAASGVCLLATNATEYRSNPFLLVKFAAIFVALANMAAIHATSAWREHRSRALSPHQRLQLGIGGGISLAAWSTALTAGRMLGYW